MRTKSEAKFASGTTAAEVIFAARPGRVSTLQNLVATSDKAASTIALYRGLAPTALNAATAADATTFKVPAGSGLAADDIVVLHDIANGTLKTATVSSVANNEAGTETTVTVGAALGVLAAGTMVYEMAAIGSLALGAATKEILRSPGFITATPETRRPLLVRVDGTSACSIDYAFAQFME